MAPIKHLPLIQNWDCHTCGSCCTDYWVPVSDEERKRIGAQGWEKEPGFEGKPLFKKYGPPWRRKYMLAQKEGDRCIFLDDRGLCMIHARFGIEAKPFACRLYPYILVPHGDHWRISMRFACPSAIANKGRPIGEQMGDLRDMAREMLNWDVREFAKPGGPDQVPVPPLQGGQRVDWDDLERFVEALLTILRTREDTVARRLLKCLAFARICRQSRFEKLNGARLKDFLDLLLTAVDAEVPRRLERIPAPTWIGRVLFRNALAIYLRKDQGVRRGVAAKSRLRLMGSMYRMLRGTGMLPPLQKGLPELTFEELEKPAGAFPREVEEVLERYYAIKVGSLQFCGPTHFDYAFWDGLNSLVLTYPMVCWLMRGYPQLGQPGALYKAITIIDENFGYSPLMGHPRQRLAFRILDARQELDRLVAWYSQ